MGFCCPHHKGVAAEFMRQFKVIPGGWKEYVKKDDSDIAAVNVTSTDSASTNKNKKARKRDS